MKGSSLILPGLGQPVQILAQPPSSASTSRSAFSSHFHTCRPIQQHSSHTTRPRQYLPSLDSESRDGILHRRGFPSSFCGDTRLRRQQKPSFSKKISKDIAHVVLKKFVGAQSFNRPFVESQQPRGTFPSLGPRTAPELEPKFPSSNVDQSKAWHLNSSGGLDQSSSSQALESVQPGSKVSSKPALGGRSGNSEQRRPRLADDSMSNQRVQSPKLQGRIEPSYMIVDPPVSRQSKTNAPTSRTWPPREHRVARVEPELRNADQRVRSSLESGAHPNSYSTPKSLGKFGSGAEPTYMVYDQARSSQNGAHPAPNKYRSPTTTVKQRYERSVIRQIPSADAFLDQWRIQKIAAELQYKRDAQWADNSSYGREAEASLRFQGERGHGSNVTQLEAPPPRARLGAADNSSYRREAEVSLRLQSERGHDSNVAQLEIPPPPARVGAAKWREAAKIIEQNRNPSHKAGLVGALQQNTDRLTIELEPVVDFANLNRGSAANEVLQIFQSEPLYREEEGPASTVIEGGGSENSVAQIMLTEELVNSGSRDNSQQANLSNLPDKAEQWINAEVLVVNNVATAEVIVEKLRGQYKDLIHACDTEVADIDVKKQSPVGHGRMICFSLYCGPKTDFGDGRCRLWVDVLGKPEVLEVFKSYFEDPSIKKVWHNYSFDRHILANHGINAKGFHADTMHLARLYDSARTVVQGGYSLEGLTADRHLMGEHWGELKMEEESAGKRSMKQLFGKPNIKKNGEEGKLRVVPPVEELQTQPEWRDKWIHYSSFDTVCTWCLWSSLHQKLGEKEWMIEGKFVQKKKFMYDFYLEYVQPFGELLVQMEAEGMMLDRDHLAKIEEVAIKQQEFAANQFKKWAAKRCPDAVYMNVGSDAQIRQLLFGGKENKNDATKRLEMERVFNAPNTENFIEEGRKVPKKTKPFTLCGLGADIPVDTYTSAGWPAVGGDALKVLAGKVSIDYNMLSEEDPVDDVFLDATGEDSAILTSTGVKGGSEEDLSVYGKAFMAFGGGKEGKEACMALAALCEVSSINTLISNFIQPLQGNDIKGPDGRIHCSLNINTETGRLSARRPSLQNQPALEKDRYKIRQAFIAGPGKSLIVADYGQLELRILAHLTDCKSMLKAFVDGGDFHSRTAMNMYAHVRNAVENGDVILEWEPKPGETKPPVPLLKDVFGAERRKAKMLNFSIAYGKTAMGLSKDWKVSLDEAKSTVELWYSDRQEVLRWQQQRIKEANDTHHVHTLLGRTRHFPDVKSSSRLVRGHIERAAINTPVQGSAADVAMCAMLQISRDKKLRELGWKLLLQVHDEVILEGPSDSAAVAKDLVVKCMGFPFGGKNNLKVALAVDAKFAQSWYAAK